MRQSSVYDLKAPRTTHRHKFRPASEGYCVTQQGLRMIKHDTPLKVWTNYEMYSSLLFFQSKEIYFRNQ